MTFVLSIHACISSVSYACVIGAQVLGLSRPKRGLRQGDSLWSYQVILCAECFSSLYIETESQKKIQGLIVSRSTLTISHLVFVDGSSLFCKENMEEMPYIVGLIDLYGSTSGQKLSN